MLLTQEIGLAENERASGRGFYSLDIIDFKGTKNIRRKLIFSLTNLVDRQ